MTEIPGSQPPAADPSQPTTSAQPYAHPAAPYAQAVYAPSKKGNRTLKIVLIVVGIIVGLGVIAVGAMGFAVYKFAKSSNMATSSQPVTAADLGVPLYPGAAQGRSIRMSVMGSDMFTANFVTADSKERVFAFYKSNLGPNAIDVTSFNGESLRLDKGAGESVTVTVSDQPGSMSGKTQIVVVNISKAASH